MGQLMPFLVRGASALAKELASLANEFTTHPGSRTKLCPSRVMTDKFVVDEGVPAWLRGELVGRALW